MADSGYRRQTDISLEVKAALDPLPNHAARILKRAVFGLQLRQRERKRRIHVQATWEEKKLQG